MNEHTPEKITLVGEAWDVYEIAGLEKPARYSDSLFKDAKILKKLLDDRDALLEACKKAIARPEEVQRIMRANNLKLDNMDEPYQGLAFTLYTMLVESANEAEAAIAKMEDV